MPSRVALTSLPTDFRMFLFFLEKRAVFGWLTADVEEHVKVESGNAFPVVRAVRTGVLETRRNHSYASEKTMRSWCTRVTCGTHRASRVNKASSHRNESSPSQKVST